MSGENLRRSPRNPEGVKGGTKPNPGRRVEGGGGISRRSFLKLVGIGLGVAGIGGLGLGLAEHNTREKHKDTIAELLEGATLVKEIRGIEIYVDNSSMRKNGPLLQELIKSLEPIIFILSDEMVRRIRFIRLDTFVLDTFVDRSTLVPFEGQSHTDVGMRLVVYPNRFKNVMSPEIEIRLAEVFFHEAVHLITFGDPNESSRMLRNYELSQCQNSLEKCILSLTNLIDRQSLKEWLEISRQNGGYVSTRQISPDQVRGEDLFGHRNFGYILDYPDISYGRLNLAEDIACIFEEIFSSLYKVIHRNENPEDVISDLLSKTPDKTGLYRKYQIACKSLMEWYEEGSEQRKILREFIQIIKDAIKKAQEATNGQSIQTNQGAIEPKGTTNPLESLMKRLNEIRGSRRKDPS